MGDIVKPVGEWIAQHVPLSVGIGIFIFLIFFEVSKIKIYPLKWLWKSASWPFRKIDEQRTQSFKNIVASMKTDLDTKLSNLTTSVDTQVQTLSTTFDNKLTEMASAQNANCTAVKSCFTELEKRFDKLDEKQVETEERLDELAAARIKNHVLNFARQCRKGEPHSHEDFANLIKEHEIYESLVAKYQSMDEVHRKKWENNVYKHDFAYIMTVYDECNKTNNFLGG